MNYYSAQFLKDLENNFDKITVCVDKRLCQLLQEVLKKFPSLIGKLELMKIYLTIICQYVHWGFFLERYK